LPGGNFSFDDFDFNLNKLSHDYPFIEEPLLRRYFENYGTLSWVLLNNINSIDDLGKDFGHGLYENEVEYLFNNEWARCAEDILWRRTKLGLHMNTQQVEIIDGWFTEKNGVLN
ncbi:glycerol-3-phosphate dehydrogenase, partial [Alphaproteobacteria bacterium]|nr:glycerol-3-phosphate dehydrogenase [Alphaproteobacteria bacterium]